jgi:hypothetical protein
VHRPFIYRLSFGITENSRAALKRLRLRDRPRVLWIDQLCINQWDNNEKARQVQLMRDIYAKSQACLIWIGEVKDEVGLANAEAAFALLSYVARFSDDSGGEVPVPEVLQSSQEFGGAMAAIDDIQGNTWWRRVWTVQESVLPPSATLLWGPLSLSWTQLSRAAQAFAEGVSPMPDRVTERMRSDRRYHEVISWLLANVIWREVAKGRTDSPAYVVQRWRFQEASDPRDKIYALLGLCSRGSLPTVEKCDYKSSVVDVFCNLTMDLILSENSLLPWRMDPRLESDKATLGMPRWALDASHILDRNTDWFHLYSWPWYRADGGNPWNKERTCAEWKISKHDLEVQGSGSTRSQEWGSRS